MVAVGCIFGSAAPWDGGPEAGAGPGGELKVSAISADSGQTVKVEAKPFPGGSRLRYLTVGTPYSIRVGSQYEVLEEREDLMSAGSFVMPNEPVLVEAVFQSVLPGEPRKVGIHVGTYDEKGNPISAKGGTASADKTEARPGETVHISTTAAEGYALYKIEWGTGTTPGELITESGTFTMWDKDRDVHVDVLFKKKAAEKVSLTGATVTGITNKVWTGKKLLQKPVVKVAGKKLKAGTDYTLTYTNNINVGRAVVTITGKGKYTGKCTKSFKINPRGTSITSVEGRKRKLLVHWKRQSAKMSKTRITGYNLQISTAGNFKKNKKTLKIKGYARTSQSIGSLLPNIKYYIRIRTYKTVRGVTYYSPWSKVKSRKMR